MLTADITTVNWEPHEAEIVSLYVDQNWTLDDTMTHMRDKHGFCATQEQFKTRFSSYKDMKIQERAPVALGVRKRTLEGKETDVYLHERQLDPKRVKTQMASCDSNFPNANVGTVIGNTLNDRISLRTPPPVSISPRPSQVAAPYDVVYDVDDECFLDIDLDVEFDFVDPTRRSNQSSLPAFAELSPRRGRFTNEKNNPDYVCSIGTPSTTSENIDLDVLYGINLELELMRDLPWFQLQHLSEKPEFISMSRVGGEIFGTPSHLVSNFSPFNLNRANLALDERHGLLSGFLGSELEKHFGDYVPHFTAKLQSLIPERQEGELSVKVQKLFDPSNKHPMYQIFEFATYFSSNNMLSNSQTDVFLKWAIDQKYTDFFKAFLQIKIPTIEVFCTKILESGIRINDSKFLKLLLNSGVKFDRVLEQAIEVKDPEFLTLLLRSGLDSSLLSGTSGGRILYAVARTEYATVAQILIQNGADVNLPICKSQSTTTLYRAVRYSNIDMVKCLLRAGADINTLCNDWNSNSALALAVSRSDPDKVVALLENGASLTSGLIDSEDILEWAALRSRCIYKILLKYVERDDKKVTIGDIVYAAECGRGTFTSFLRHQQERISQAQLEKALSMSIRLGKFDATATLLQNGVDANGPTLDDNDRPLMEAAYDGNLKFAQLLINFGASVNIPALLLTAVEYGLFDHLNLFIEAGADLDMYGPEALESAAENDSIEMAALLLDKGTDINAFGKTCTSIQAAYTIEFAQYLIERGADVNHPASAVGGYTALQGAARLGNYELVAFLLDNNADVNAPPAQTQGVTALEAALSASESAEVRRAILELLLQKGGMFNCSGCQVRTTTILHDLIEQNEEDLIPLVLKAGINLEQMSRGERGRRPLQLAAERGNLGVVKLLLDYGADVNATPAYQYGRTALQAAASCETATVELIQLLINNNADIHAQPGVLGGVTALQGAAICGHIKIALMLIKMGADVNARPAIKEGRTAIEGAAEHGRLDMVQLLLNAGAKGDVINKTGFKLAIELAEKDRHFAIAEMLTARGADEEESL